MRWIIVQACGLVVPGLAPIIPRGSAMGWRCFAEETDAVTAFCAVECKGAD